MNYKTEHLDHCIVIHLESNHLESVQPSSLKNHLLTLSEQNESTNIILDISNCNQCNESGLNDLCSINVALADKKSILVITGANEAIEKTLLQSTIELNIIPSLPESIDYIMMHEIEKEFD